MTASNTGSEVEIIVRRGDWTLTVRQESSDTEELSSFNELAEALSTTAVVAESYLNRLAQKKDPSPPPF